MSFASVCVSVVNLIFHLMEVVLQKMRENYQIFDIFLTLKIFKNKHTVDNDMGA